MVSKFIYFIVICFLLSSLQLLFAYNSTLDFIFSGNLIPSLNNSQNVTFLCASKNDTNCNCKIQSNINFSDYNSAMLFIGNLKYSQMYIFTLITFSLYLIVKIYINYKKFTKFLMHKGYVCSPKYYYVDPFIDFAFLGMNPLVFAIRYNNCIQGINNIEDFIKNEEIKPFALLVTLLIIGLIILKKLKFNFRPDSFLSNCLTIISMLGICLFIFYVFFGLEIVWWSFQIQFHVIINISLLLNCISSFVMAYWNIGCR